jgi:hypothetical protein
MVPFSDIYSTLSFFVSLPCIWVHEIFNWAFWDAYGFMKLLQNQLKISMLLWVHELEGT